MRKRLSILLIAASAGAASGCSLFHHGKSPQQQYMEALMRGNSVQAATIYTSMSQDDRMKLSRGEGFSPKAAGQDEDSVKRSIMDHYQDQMENGPSTAEEMEKRDFPTPLGDGLKQMYGGQPPTQ